MRLTRPLLSARWTPCPGRQRRRLCAALGAPLAALIAGGAVSKGRAPLPGGPLRSTAGSVRCLPLCASVGGALQPLAGPGRPAPCCARLRLVARSVPVSFGAPLGSPHASRRAVVIPSPPSLLPFAFGSRLRFGRLGVAIASPPRSPGSHPWAPHVAAGLTRVPTQSPRVDQGHPQCSSRSLPGSTRGPPRIDSWLPSSSGARRHRSLPCPCASAVEPLTRPVRLVHGDLPPATCSLGQRDSYASLPPTFPEPTRRINRPPPCDAVAPHPAVWQVFQRQFSGSTRPLFASAAAPPSWQPPAGWHHACHPPPAVATPATWAATSLSMVTCPRLAR